MAHSLLDGWAVAKFLGGIGHCGSSRCVDDAVGAGTDVGGKGAFVGDRKVDLAALLS